MKTEILEALFKANNYGYSRAMEYHRPEAIQALAKFWEELESLRDGYVPDIFQPSTKILKARYAK